MAAHGKQQFLLLTEGSFALLRDRASLARSKRTQWLQYNMQQQLLALLTAGGIAVWDRVASRLLHVLAYLFERLPLRSAGMAALKPAGSLSK